MKARRTHSRAGFTLVEILVALMVGLAVLSGVMTAYVWMAQKISFAEKVSWSHRMALTSGRDVMDYLRNATEILAIDADNAWWVEVRMPDGSESRFVYVNPVEFQRDGYMYMTNAASGRCMVVARGMTEIMTSDGFSPGIFTQTSPSTLRLRYRVVEPVPQRPGENQDSLLGAIVDETVCLRNAPR